MIILDLHSSVIYDHQSIDKLLNSNPAKNAFMLYTDRTVLYASRIKQFEISCNVE